jgi:hypothetical protein
MITRMKNDWIGRMLLRNRTRYKTKDRGNNISDEKTRKKRQAATR